MTFGALKHINHAEGFIYIFLNLSKQMWQFTRFHAVCTCCLNKAALWSMSIPSAESWSKSTISLRCTTTDPGYIILWHNQAKKMMRINFSPCQSSLQSSLVVMFDFYHCAPWPSCCLKCRKLKSLPGINLLCPHVTISCLSTVIFRIYTLLLFFLFFSTIQI